MTKAALLLFRPLPALFCLVLEKTPVFVDGGGTAGKVLLRGPAGVPLTVWKEKQRGGRRNHTFSPSLGRMLFLELSLSGIHGADSLLFFHFP